MEPSEGAAPMDKTAAEAEKARAVAMTTHETAGA
jgi:hypothetical protein